MLARRQRQAAVGIGRIVGEEEEVFGAALISPGLYQVNLRVPNIADGEYALTLEVAGQRSPANTIILIRR